MSDQIKKDDEKFNDLIVKQTLKDVKEPSKYHIDDGIDSDDEKMDDFLFFQDIKEMENPPVYNSIEEKYEKELFVEELGRNLMEQFNKMDKDDNGFEQFFPSEENI